MSKRVETGEKLKLTILEEMAVKGHLQQEACDIVFMKMKVIRFCLRETISGSYLK